MNRHSLLFKVVSHFTLFTLFLGIAIGYINFNQVDRSLKASEDQKLELLISNLLPEISLNLSYGFYQAVSELGNEFIRRNPNILEIRVSEAASGKVITFSNPHKGDEEHGHISRHFDIVDPSTQTPIGTLDALYSHRNYLMMMKDYTASLLIFLVIYLVFMVLLGYLILRYLKPVNLLARAIVTFNPRKPAMLELPERSDDEVGRITDAVGSMIRRILRHESERNVLTTQLEETARHLAEAQRIAELGSWTYNLDTEEFFQSRELHRLLESDGDPQTLHLRSVSRLLDAADRSLIYASLRALIRENAPFEIQHRIRTFTNKELFLRTSVDLQTNEREEYLLVGTSLNVTEEVRNKKLVEHMAFHDALTGLPNRLLLKERLTQQIAASKRAQTRTAVLFLDLDHFKLINDSMGHMVGDKLVQRIAATLEELQDEADTVARIGGDEFVIVIPSVAERGEAIATAEALIERMQQRWEIDDHAFYTTTSIGIALYPDDAEESENLIKFADIAMYQAKRRGRNNFQFFEPSMFADTQLQYHLEQDLRLALEQCCDQFELYFQPKVSTREDTSREAEALIRWNHPEHGLLVPATFIEIAETTGMIIELGEWIIRNACSHIGRACDAGHELRVSINLSGRQFQHKDLIETVASAIHEFSIPPHLLDFEITESVSMNNIRESGRIMRELKKLGVTLSIDDFGTGYSSLAYLKHFPLDTLKIDRSFISEIHLDADDRIIAEAVIIMGHTLGMTIVAEGVEYIEHVQLLRQMHCDRLQGHFFTPPIPYAELMAFYERLASEPPVYLT